MRKPLFLNIAKGWGDVWNINVIKSDKNNKVHLIKIFVFLNIILSLISCPQQQPSKDSENNLHYKKYLIPQENSHFWKEEIDIGCDWSILEDSHKQEWREIHLIL